MKRRRGQHLSRFHYVELLADIKRKPGTIQQFIERWGLGRTMVYRFVTSLHAMDVLHIKGWHFKARTPAKPIYAFGDWPDADLPEVRRGGAPIESPPKVIRPSTLPAELVGLVSVIRELESAMTADEVAAATGLDPQRMRRLLDCFHAHGLAHIPRWRQRPNGGPQVPLFIFGEGEDAPKLPISRSAVNARYRQRVRLMGATCPLVRTLVANGIGISSPERIAQPA